MQNSYDNNQLMDLDYRSSPEIPATPPEIRATLDEDETIHGTMMYEKTYSEMMPDDLDSPDTAMDARLNEVNERDLMLVPPMEFETVRMGVHLTADEVRELEARRDAAIDAKYSEWVKKETQTILDRKEYYRFADAERVRRLDEAKHRIHLEAGMKADLARANAKKRVETTKVRGQRVAEREADYYNRQHTRCVAAVKMHQMKKEAHAAKVAEQTMALQREQAAALKARAGAARTVMWAEERRTRAIIEKARAREEREAAKWDAWKEANASKKPYFKVAGGSVFL